MNINKSYQMFWFSAIRVLFTFMSTRGCMSSCYTRFLRDHSETLMGGGEWCKKGSLKFLCLVRVCLEKRNTTNFPVKLELTCFSMGLSHNFHGKKGALAFAMTRHARHFDGQLPFLTGMLKMRWRAKNPQNDRQHASIALSKVYNISTYFPIFIQVMVYCSIVEQNQHKVIFNTINLFRIQA